MTEVKISVAAACKWAVGAVHQPELAASSSPALPGKDEVQHEATEIQKMFYTALNYQSQNLHLAFKKRSSAEAMQPPWGGSKRQGKRELSGSEPRGDA